MDGDGAGCSRTGTGRSEVRRGIWIGSLLRRKPVNSHRNSQLAKELSAIDLVAIGVGATIGAGVYVLVGTVAREHSGPALTISFLIAGIAAALSAFCYAELASRCPSAGSAYHFSYICIGESVAWLIGWALILEYTVGGSAIARGVSPNLALFLGGSDSLPFFLARMKIEALDIVVDPCAAILVLVVTGLLCAGIKESAFVQATVTTANVLIMAFIVVVGAYLGFKTGWGGYRIGSYFPNGVNGILAGSATVFFSFIGFDVVASTAEEVKQPQSALPLGIGLSLSICCLLYMMVSVVIVGLVPYSDMDPYTPISSAFSVNGMQWASYVITAGAVLALCSTLLGSLLPQPRMFMAMARDGLLPPFFSDVSVSTQVPVKSTVLTGIVAATLAFLMDVSELAGMVSVGTLLAYTIVAISTLILRYVSPDDVPVPSSFQQSIYQDYALCDSEEDDRNIRGPVASNPHYDEVSSACLFGNDRIQGLSVDKTAEQLRRRKAAWSISFLCIGSLILMLAASAAFLFVVLRIAAFFLGGIILLYGLGVLYCIKQDDSRHNFGRAGGFLCPFVPVLPTCCILINAYLLINLGSGTWIRVSVWLLLGALIYLFYGRKYSLLTNTTCISITYFDKPCDQTS